MISNKYTYSPMDVEVLEIKKKKIRKLEAYCHGPKEIGKVDGNTFVYEWKAECNPLSKEKSNVIVVQQRDSVDVHEVVIPENLLDNNVIWDIDISFNESGNVVVVMELSSNICICFIPSTNQSFSFENNRSIRCGLDYSLNPKTNMVIAYLRMNDNALCYRLYSDGFGNEFETGMTVEENDLLWGIGYHSSHNRFVFHCVKDGVNATR